MRQEVGSMTYEFNPASYFRPHTSYIMIGHHFNKYDPNEQGKTKFQQLLDVFMQLLTYTSGDVSEALQWLNQLDREYEMTDEEYGVGDFIDELKEKGYITEEQQTGQIKITPK